MYLAKFEKMLERCSTKLACYHSSRFSVTDSGPGVSRSLQVRLEPLKRRFGLVTRPIESFHPWYPVRLYLQHLLSTLTFPPDLAANMIGRSNARRGARRMFAVLQNRRLNQHIAYTVADEVWLTSRDYPANTDDNSGCRSLQPYSRNLTSGREVS